MAALFSVAASSWGHAVRCRPCIHTAAAPRSCTQRMYRRSRQYVTVKASADGPSVPPSGGGNSDEGPATFSLVRKFPGPEATFMLAGFLKILTIGGLASTAPVDAVRSAAGMMSQYMLVPFALVLCWLAKVIVDNDLQESKRFMAALCAFLVLLYFGLYKLLYKFDPRAELPMTSRAAVNSPVARLRAQLGDRELGTPGGQGMMLDNTRSYVQERVKSKGYDDLAWYEGQYASDMRARAEQPPAQEDAASSHAVWEARNPLRGQYKRSY